MFTQELKLYLAKLAIPVGLLGGIAFVANIASSDTHCPQEEAAAGLCTPSTPLTVPTTTPTTSGGSGTSTPTTVAPAPPTTTAPVPTTSSTVPRTNITKALVLSWCNGCTDARLTELPEFGNTIVKIAPGDAVTVSNTPADVCIDTPSGNMLRAPQTAPTMTVRPCVSSSTSSSSSSSSSTSSGGTNSSVVPNTTTTVPATASNKPSGGCDPSVLGGRWVPAGSNMWKLVGASTAISVPSGGPVWVVDHPMGSITNGQSVTAAAATAYCFA
jgi:hypothetical protein